MSKEVDSLVIIGHAERISRATRDLVRDDIFCSLSHLEGRDTWASTSEQRANLQAGDVFLSLGTLVESRFTGNPHHGRLQHNPTRQSTLKVIDSISPLGKGEQLSTRASISELDDIDERGLRLLLSNPEDAPVDELHSKWSKAEAVYTRRGEVEFITYDLLDVLDTMHELSQGGVAPDVVVFDENDQIKEQVFDFNSVMQHGEVQLRRSLVPYYYTFGSNNAVQMLESAVVDLRAVSAAIKE